MEFTKEFIEQKRAENPGCKLARVALKAEDEKSVALEVFFRWVPMGCIGSIEGTVNIKSSI